jgi:hypothetical protein
MKLIWLDDIRNPNSLIPCEYCTWIEKYAPFQINTYTNVDIVWIKTYDEFVFYILKNDIPDGISFDNDLGEEKEGYDCAKFLVNYCIDNNKKLPKFNVHSYNCVARENIFNLLNNFNRHNK